MDSRSGGVVKPQKGMEEAVYFTGGRELVCMNTWNSKSVVNRSWSSREEPPVTPPRDRSVRMD